jgi:hypothetical protein
LSEVWVSLGKVFGLVDFPCDPLVCHVVGFQVGRVEWGQCDAQSVYERVEICMYEEPRSSIRPSKEISSQIKLAIFTK